ncbi:chloramphenicol-sensitive protein RarD [Frankineae bacterium MT45]|nr:chloramphenicol-sensitive protein RarD [Frankineae bacterium MT45]
MTDPAGAEQHHLRRGYIFGVAAYLLWGLFPLYWPLLEPASALEILAHRVVWSLAFVALLVWRGHSWPAVRHAVAVPRTRWLLVLAAVVVAVNWGVYIWGVNSGHVIETSLGYFINPLLSIVAGVVIFKERLRPMQWVAVGIASLAIVVLTANYGRLPWIALILAFSFATYGFCKKSAGVGAVESLAVETAVLFIPAVVTLFVLQLQGTLVYGHHGGGNTLLLMTTGLVTAIPLLFFGAAARRLPLSAIGMLQYLAPVLQFAVGVGLKHESMPAARWIGFGLVWTALILLTFDALRRQRRGAGAPVSPEPDAAVEPAI